jgi:hypothetical protein
LPEAQAEQRSRSSPERCSSGGMPLSRATAGGGLPRRKVTCGAIGDEPRADLASRRIRSVEPRLADLIVHTQSHRIPNLAIQRGKDCRRRWEPQSGRSRQGRGGGHGPGRRVTLGHAEGWCSRRSGHSQLSRTPIQQRSSVRCVATNRRRTRPVLKHWTPRGAGLSHLAGAILGFGRRLARREGQVLVRYDRWR